MRAKRPRRLPVVLTPREVDQVLAHLEGVVLLICRLLYGSGMRLLECLDMRVKDLDFRRNEITVRDGKGRKDRVTMLPEHDHDLHARPERRRPGQPCRPAPPEGAAGT